MRRLLCAPCGHAYTLHPSDLENGIQLRKVIGLARKPAVFNRTTTTYDGKELREVMKVVEELPSLLCDSCGKHISDGVPAIATTEWQDQEPEPAEWESEYFTKPFAPPVDPVLQPLVDHANAIALGLKPLP